MEKLVKIQSELKAPKGQFNAFGKYKYRNCEDILEALKPLLKKHGCLLVITDEIKEINGVIFVEATVTLRAEGTDSFESVKAQAGIDVHKKGMDIAQTFGSSSSYARKYALNGLFLIDDTKDADNNDNKKSKGLTPPPEPTIESLPTERFNKAIKLIETGELTVEKLKESISPKYDLSQAQINKLKRLKN